jgi:hypothetical protein
MAKIVFYCESRIIYLASYGVLFVIAVVKQKSLWGLISPSSIMFLMAKARFS